MTPNSATILDNETVRLYSDSGGVEGISEWIQLPISRQVFEHGGKIVDNIYVQVKPFEVTLPVVDSLLEEFAAWEAASDEALLSFEKENL